MSSTYLIKTNFNSSDSFLSYKLNLRLRELRKINNLTQTQLGKILADNMNLKRPIPTSTIASWEHIDSNLSKVPSEEKIKALASIFGVSIDYLKGLSNDPNQSLNEFISNNSCITPIKILPQELSQHIGRPIWVTYEAYDGWMLLTNNFNLVDSSGNFYQIDRLIQNDANFAIFPPCHAYFNQVYNRYVIPETIIRNYKDKIWVCLNSPDVSAHKYDGWYTRLPDGTGVKGKTILTYDTYFELWLAYTSPLT